MKFSRLSRYDPSLGSILRDDMSKFATGVADLVREECCTAMIQDDMTQDRLMVYAQSIEESRRRRIARNLKRNDSSDIMHLAI